MSLDLEDTLLLFRIPAWSDSDRASLVAHPKLFLFDTGTPSRLSGGPRAGALDLRTLAGGGSYHFRTRHGAEVDYVLEACREDLRDRGQGITDR